MDKWRGWTAAEHGDWLQDDKTMENIDWESCHSKYQDIIDKYKEMCPTAEDAENLGKDFPYNKEDITKLIVTSKLKSVWVKYRQEVVMAELFYCTLSYANKSGAAPRQQ